MEYANEDPLVFGEKYGVIHNTGVKVGSASPIESFYYLTMEFVAEDGETTTYWSPTSPYRDGQRESQ